MKNLLFLLLLLLFSGCKAWWNKNVNPYYFGLTMVDDTKYQKTKNIASYNYSDENVKYFLKRGYVIIAKSAFRYRYVHPTWAELTAQQLGATVMLLDKKYVSSVSGKKALIWNVPGDTYRVTSNTEGNIYYNSNTNSYVIGDSGFGYGNSSTYGEGSYNSTTTTTIQAPDKYYYTSVPYTHHYYDQYGVFMIKKYYWCDYGATYYKTKKLEDKIDYLKPGEWFELLQETKKFKKILYNGNVVYIGSKVSIN